MGSKIHPSRTQSRDTNMKLKPTTIEGVYIIELEKHTDERGFFARSWCTNEFTTWGLHTNFVQHNISYNRKKGTLRGMHYQIAPYEEIKLVTCMKGAMYDVVLDIRESSATYGKWLSVELTDQNNKTLYIPKGIAHGFQTLQDESLVFYQMSEFYNPDSARGIKYDDERFLIKWPIEEGIIISQKDTCYE